MLSDTSSYVLLHCEMIVEGREGGEDEEGKWREGEESKLFL